MIQSELYALGLRHLNKFKYVSDKYASRISGNLFMKSYENYKENIYPTNTYWQIRDSDADKSIQCYKQQEDFKLPH